MKKVLALSLTMVLILVPLLTFAKAQTEDEAYLVPLGDIGCVNTAISNLKNIDTANASMLGLGDYMYGCSPGKKVDVGGSTKVKLETLYTAIEQKVGAAGNHECEKKQQTAWAAKTFKFKSCDKGWSSWKFHNIGIIIINPYTDFGVGSDQYNYVVQKSKQFANRSDIDWTVYAFHPNLWTPTVGGGHGPDKELREVYEPIIFKYNGVVISGHNHIVAWGLISNSIPVLICGGGGEGGDKIGKLNGFIYGTSAKLGYCLTHFTEDSLLVQHIGTNGVVLAGYEFEKPLGR